MEKQQQTERIEKQDRPRKIETGRGENDKKKNRHTDRQTDRYRERESEHVDATDRRRPTKGYVHCFTATGRTDKQNGRTEPKLCSTTEILNFPKSCPLKRPLSSPARARDSTTTASATTRTGNKLSCQESHEHSIQPHINPHTHGQTLSSHSEQANRTECWAQTETNTKQHYR